MTPQRPTQLLRAEGPFATFADHLIARELPELPTERRALTVAFVCRRTASLPSPLLIGVSLLGVALGVALRIAGLDRTTTFLQATRLPFVGELARLVRSLGFAFVWETWPDTSPAGADLGGVAA